ncbi:MAG TPA: amino acid adenylation domain-containing protein, partial [Thermoanaerobaculia bacterium]|nr:amino acid adenylation domain-containing protein [Thermoanaerobaculia bacterium]
LLAGFAALLRRVTGQGDLVVGTATANRGHAAAEGLIGFFVNSLPLRVDAAGDPAWKGLLGRVRETTLAAYAHQEMPFARLVEELSPERSLAQTPLFQVALVLQNLPVRAAGLPGLSLVPVPVDTGTAKHDWMLTFGEESDGLAGTFEYATELFDAPTIERCLGAFERLLGEVAADPGRRISGLDLLSPAERAQVVREWNDTAPVGVDEAVQMAFARQARNDPAAPALQYRGLSWSYGELEARADRLAGHLWNLGVGSSSLVAVCLRRSPAAMAAILGVLRAGGAFLPMDPDDPAERLGRVLADSGASLLLTEAGLAGALPPHGAKTVLVEEMLETPASPVPPEIPDPLHLAYVIYTSGSTGQPKGVAVTHGGLSNMVRAQVGLFGVEASDRVLQFAAASFDASVSEIFMALTSGACLVLEDREALRPGPGLAAWLEAEAISVLTLTPPALAVLPPAELPALRTLIVAGEACPPELADRWGMGRRLWNAYGPTEGTVCATAVLHLPGRDRLPIGRPIDGVHVHLVDEGGEPVPVGVTGELALGGAGVARGYLGRPDLTAERFVPDSFGEQPGGRLYRTGDLGRLLSTGEIEFLGRRDTQVKIRGHRVEPGEVEAVLAAHPAVEESAVVVRDDGPAGRRLVACVTAATQALGLRQELRAYLEARLPSHMVPAEIAVLPGLPRTSAGKVDRRALTDLLTGGAGAPGDAGDGGGWPPANPLEELVAGIFAEVLGRDRVGADGQFFDLGGHSLMATQVMSRVEAVLGVELPLQALFEAPTVAGLAERVAAAGPGRRRPPAIERLPRPRKGEMPLSFGQQRLWLIDQLEPG